MAERINWKRRALAAEAEVRRLRAIYNEDGLEDAELAAAVGKRVSFFESAACTERDGPRQFVPPKT